MSGLINIGFGNVVNADRIISVVSYDSAPAKRLVQQARDMGNAIDATQGRKTKSIIVMTDKYIVLSALQPETITSRCNMHEEVNNSEQNAEY